MTTGLNVLPSCETLTDEQRIYVYDGKEWVCLSVAKNTK